MNVDPGTAEKKKEGSRQFSITLDSIQGFEFRVKFDQAHIQDLLIDEAAPLGNGSGPDPGRLLAAAVGGCLSASFLFCAQKLRLGMDGLHTNVKVTHTRNEKGRLRIGKIDVELDPRIPEPDDQKLQRCIGLYEDFCVVTQSVRSGLDVSVKVKS
jgi:uncharacterized OsmC-like protein